MPEVGEATVWTEYNVDLGDVEQADHLPGWWMKNDSWEFSGGEQSKIGETVLDIPFSIDSNLDKFKVRCTATNGTIKLQLEQGGILKEDSDTVTTEETITLEVDIKNEGFSSGKATMRLIAQGAYYITNVVPRGVYFGGGWTEYWCQ